MQEEFLNFKEKQYTKLESPGECTYKVQHYEDNKIYTMFVRSKGSYVKGEFAMLQKASHPNVAKVKEWFYGTRGKEIIITEYAESLELRIKEKPLTEEEMKPIVRDVLKALVHLDKKKISHLDVKPANIYLKDNKAFLNNFGFASHYNNLTNIENPVGTAEYMSPEMQAVPTADWKNLEKSDIYSLGVTMKQMLENFETSASIELSIFVSSAMSNGAIRPDATELLEHEWFQSEKKLWMKKLVNMFK